MLLFFPYDHLGMDLHDGPFINLEEMKPPIDRPNTVLIIFTKR